MFHENLIYICIYSSEGNDLWNGYKKKIQLLLNIKVTVEMLFEITFSIISAEQLPQDMILWWIIVSVTF